MNDLYVNPAETELQGLTLVVETVKTSGEKEIGLGDLDLIKSELSRFKQLVELYESGLQTIKTRLEVLAKELAVTKKYNPIETVKSRMKTFESAIGKLQSKGCPINVQSIKDNIFDLAGVRVICPFINDVYDIFEMLNRQTDLEFIRVRDYIGKPKESGYRSLHAVIMVPVFLSSGAQSVPVEIQIRTLAMDFWASIEHHLQYKVEYSDGEDFSGGERVSELKKCADEIAQIDRRMQSLSGVNAYDLS